MAHGNRPGSPAGTPVVNALTISELPKDLRTAFRDIIAELDRRYNSDTEADMTVEELAGLTEMLRIRAQQKK